MTARRVAIFGGSDSREGDPLFAAAEALGRACAREGWVLVNGGYGGTMLAAARGAAQAGGRAIGVTCSVFNSPPNPFIAEEIRTGDLFERLRRLIELGDAYVCLPGSTGTLAELAVVWEMVNKRMIGRRPILCWGEFWRPVIDLFARDPNRDPRIPALARIDEKRGQLITFVNTVEEAVVRLRLGFRA